MHELGTNAIKYGALSVAEGRLDIDWSLEGDDDDRKLIFHWRESDGPKVRVPERRGVGSLLRERSILDISVVEIVNTDDPFALSDSHRKA